MKQQLSVIAECGAVTIMDAAQSIHRYPVPPFASFFESAWRIIKKDYSYIDDDPDAEIIVYYGSLQYSWDREAVRKCFVQHLLDEKELADVMLVSSNS